MSKTPTGKAFRRLVAVCLIGFPGIVLLAVVLAVQLHPFIDRSTLLPSPMASDAAQTRQLLQQLDPRRETGAPLRKVLLTEAQVNLLTAQAAGRFGGAMSRVRLPGQSAMLQASFPIRVLPVELWLNVDAQFANSGRLPALERLRIGRLPVPAPLCDWLWRRLISEAMASQRGKLAAEIIKQVAFAPNQLTIVYEWSGDTGQRVMAALVSDEDQQRLRAYSERLADAVANAAAGQPIALENLLGPMFELALRRGGADELKIARENRAALVALAFYATGRDLAVLDSAARSWRRPLPHPLTIQGRDDFPQHFLVSAAIAADAGGPLTDAIGIYKEVSDTRGGSGFSFNDIAADRAGTRFGLLAARSPTRLAARVAAGVKEADFMPSVADLPEFLTEVEFRRRYGAIGSETYALELASIETRLDAMPLLR